MRARIICVGLLLELASGLRPCPSRCWAADGAPAGAPVAATAAPDDDDVRARDLFVSGQYAAALVVYTRLYQQTRHPTYQRNIGRCHQMLRQPEEAIRWFEAYLRAVPALAPAERAEIQGYIAEMRALRATNAAPPAPVAPPVIGPAATTPGWSPAPEPATVSVTGEGGGASAPSSRKWWILTGVGAVVVGVVVFAVLSSRGESRLPCPAETICGP